MLVRLFVLVGGLIVVALTVALIGPYFIDWTPYRADFEREASRILGRQVTVAGTASARLLPFPSVTFSDVRVAGQDGAGPVMTADRFSMDAELAPFLRGEVLIFDMRVVRPRIRLGVDEDGTVDLAIRPESPVDPQLIELENVSVINGEIALDHRLGGREHILSAIDARISARSLAGPWRAEGTMRADGHPLSFLVSTGSAEVGGTMRLRLRLNPRDIAVAVETDGDARMEDGRVSYSGRFSLADFKPGDRLRGSGGGTFALPGETGGVTGDTYRMNGRFTLDNKSLGIDEFRFETGNRDDPYVAEGTAFIDLGADPRFAIKADGQQWRVPQDSVTGPATISLKKRLDALAQVVAAIPEPNIPGTVDINLPAIVAGGTTIRDIRLFAEPAGETWEIRTATAKLPGRSTVEVRGTLSAGAEPGFSGSLLLAVAQPSGFAAWLANDVNEAIRKLSAAGFSATVDLNREKQVFDNLELILGDARFTGSIKRTDPLDGKPAIEARLKGGALNGDGLAAFASIFTSESGMRFPGHDLDMEISAGPVGINGLEAALADTALRLKGDRLEIDKLTIGDLYGASISATGTITGLESTPAGRFDASIVAVDLGPLVSRLAEVFPENGLAAAAASRADGYPGLLNDGRVNVIASFSGVDAANDRGAALSANGVAGGTSFSLSATGSPRSLTDPDANFSLSLTAANDDGGRLLALYGLPVLPIDLAGALETEVIAEGSLRNGLKVSASLWSGDDAANFAGTVKAVEDLRVNANGIFKIDVADMEPWLAATGFSYPGMGIGLPVSLQAPVSLENGVLTFSGLEGKIVDGAVSGEIDAILENGRPKLTGAAYFDTLLLDPFAMALLGADAFEAEPGNWPNTPFAPALRVPAALDLQVSAKAVDGGAAGFATNAAFKLRLDDDGLQISDFAGDYAGGRVAGRLELKNNGGTGLFSTQIQVTDAQVESLIPQSGLGGHASLAGVFTASGKSVESLVASLAGSGTISVRDFAADGLNTTAFDDILKRADEAGRDIESADIDGFALPLVSDGRFGADLLSFPFSVASGVLRTAPVPIEGEGAEVSIELKADLPAGDTNIEGRMTYDAGKEALVGSEPVVRFTAGGSLAAVTATYDLSELKQYLAQRALEREQARVERMQAVLLEKQRLRRYVRLFLYEEDVREAERLRREEEARQAEEARKADEEARRAEEEARKTEEEARRSADKGTDAEKPALPGVFPDGKLTLDEFIRSLSQE